VLTQQEFSRRDLLRLAAFTSSAGLVAYLTGCGPSSNGGATPTSTGDSAPDALHAVVAEVMAAYRAEIAKRKKVNGPVTLLQVAADKGGPNIIGGSIVVLSGLSGSKDLQAIRAAAEGGDAVKASTAIDAFEKRLAGVPDTKPSIPKDVAGQVAKIPTLGQVVYSDAVLADALVIAPGNDLALARLPYAGAALDPAKFAVNYFHTDEGSKQEIETLVLVRPPKLTAVEEAVLKNLPEELIAKTIGEPGTVANWGLAAAAAVFVFVVVAGVYLAERAQREAQLAQEEQQREVERQADQGQEQEANKQDDSGNLGDWLTESELDQKLSGLDVADKLSSLLLLRSKLVQTGRIG
jgi:hypothetical protein